MPLVPAKSVLAVGLVVAISLGLAWLLSSLLFERRLSEQRQALVGALENTAYALENEASRAAAAGATILMGLNDPLLKASALGKVPRDAPQVLARLAISRLTFEAMESFVMAEDGTIVAHDPDGKRATGTNLAYRPYFKNALNGIPSFYAAVGSINVERGVFYAAPLLQGDQPDGRVIGAVVLKIAMDQIDQLLGIPGGDVLLLSPQGVVFGATREKWLMRMLPSNTESRVSEILDVRQFGGQFRAARPEVLPFDPNLDELEFNHTRYVVNRRSVDWRDPAGPWMVVSLHDESLLVSAEDRQKTTLWLFGGLLGFGLLSLQVLASRTRMARAFARHKRLGTALEISPVAMAVCENDGVIEWVNPQFEMDTGYSLAELTGKPIGLIIRNEKQNAGVEESRRHFRQGLSWRGELVNRRKDGSYFQARTLVAPVLESGGRTLGFVALQEDTTEARKLQDQITEQNDFLNVLMETIPIPLFYKDASTRFLGFNLAYEKAFGVDRRDLIGKRVMDLHYLPESDRLVYQKEDEQAIADASTVQRQVSMPYADGELHPTLYWVRGFRRHDGSPGGLIGTFVDISDQERAQEQLRRARDAADAANRAKGDFLANMSHEIRTPMNAIIGMSHLVLKTELSVRQRDYVSKIQQSGKNLLGIIDDILDVSKVEAGKLTVERIPFDLDAVIGNVLNVVSDKAGAKGLELVLDVAEAVPHQLLGDPLRLGQVLVNYVNNAVKFTSRGSINLSVRLNDGDQSEPGSEVLLYFEVRDTGIGIAPEQVARLFQTFEQGDASTTRQYGGTGLGLSISKGLVGLMGGTVGVSSAVGEGSTFWFTARLGVDQDQRKALVQAELASEVPSDPASALAVLAPLLGARILLVEDNEINQQVAAELLQDAGFWVDIAGNGQVAVDKVNASNGSGLPYDLVLMDLQMPVLDGLGATLEIRRNPRNMLLPIAAMTANVMSADRQRCVSVGMTGFLAKPLDPDELWSLLAGLIRWREGLGQRPPPPADSVWTASPPPSAVPAQVLLLNIAGLDVRLGLRRVMGHQSRYLSMLRKFMVSQANVPRELADALDTADLARAERIAHTLKGLAGTIGALALEAAAGPLEDAIRYGKSREAISGLMASPCDLLADLISALQAKLPSDQIGPSGVPASPGQVQAACARLARLLADDDAEAEDAFTQSAEMLRTALGSDFARLKTAIETFSFDKALTLLNQACSANQIHL